MWDTVIAVLGAVAAIVAAAISWRVYVEQRRSDFPLVTVDLQASKMAGWWTMQLHVRNRSLSEWHGTFLNVRRPAGLRLVSQFDARSRNETGEYGIDFATADAQASRRAVVHVSVAAQGVRGNTMVVGTSDSHWETFWLTGAPEGSRVSMRLSLLSSDARPRSMTIAINRQLPPHARTPID